MATGDPLCQCGCGSYLGQCVRPAQPDFELNFGLNSDLDDLRRRAEKAEKELADARETNTRLHRRVQAVESEAARVPRIREGYARDIARTRRAGGWKARILRKHYDEACALIVAAGVSDEWLTPGYSPTRTRRLTNLIPRLVAQRDAARSPVPRKYRPKAYVEGAALPEKLDAETVRHLLREAYIAGWDDACPESDPPHE